MLLVEPSRRFFSPQLSLFFRKRLMEMRGLLLIALSGAIVCALATYTPFDAALNVATTHAHAKNLVGAFGAYVADVLFQWLGEVAWAIPPLFFVWGARRLVHRKGTRLIFSMVWGSCFLGVSVLGLAYFSSHYIHIYGQGSGISGPLLTQLVEPWVQAVQMPHFVGVGMTLLGSFFLLGLALEFSPRTIVWGGYTSLNSFSKALLWGAVSSAKLLWKGLVNRDIIGGQGISSNLDDVEFDTPQKLPKKSKRRAKKEVRALPKEGTQMSMTLVRDSAFQLPSLELLHWPKEKKTGDDDQTLRQRGEQLITVLSDFGVKGEIGTIRQGPVVTLFELEPARGTKSGRVIGLSDDIARSMRALSVRVGLIPGRSALGIELPNETRQTVYLKELLTSSMMRHSPATLPLVLGQDIGGAPEVVDLAKMPHLLVAGTTGSGKSVGINAMILSLLYTHPPERCRFIMVDPKMLELSIYDGIPHLLSPVVTDPRKAVVALKWVVREMEERYKAMSCIGVRNIDGFNKKVSDALEKGKVLEREIQTGFDAETGEAIIETQTLATKPYPYIVVIVDELADLMLVAGKDVEGCIQRIAQMARAAGIHLIMATQRPSVDVITGTIKANFPSRISFHVTSKIDSRTILGEGGAERLLGKGDMLYSPGGGALKRVHGPFVSDQEVEDVVRVLKKQGTPEYVQAVTEGGDEVGDSGVFGLSTEDSGGDELYNKALEIVRRDRKASTSYIQRKLQIGYNRAARIIEEMEERGVVSSANHVGKREVLIDKEAG